LLSTVYDLMSQVVFGVPPSVRAAYRAHEADVGASIISVSHKRNGLETHTSSALVRSRAHALAPLMKHMDGDRAPWLAAYRVTILDGNGLPASAHRLQELREAAGRALPGKSLVVSAPAQELVTDVLPCEDGHAPERALLGSVLTSVQREDLWMADRHFCPRAFLTEIDAREGFFVLRAPQGVPWERVSPLRSCGRTPTGQRAEQRVCVVDAQGHNHVFRRLQITLEHATRDGDKALSLLTNVPRQISAPQVAQLDHNRWKWETAFPP
jgi:hypothetical protein